MIKFFDVLVCLVPCRYHIVNLTRRRSNTTQHHSSFKMQRHYALFNLQLRAALEFSPTNPMQHDAHCSQPLSSLKIDFDNFVSLLRNNYSPLVALTIISISSPSLPSPPTKQSCFTPAVHYERYVVAAIASKANLRLLCQALTAHLSVKRNFSPPFLLPLLDIIP